MDIRANGLRDQACRLAGELRAAERLVPDGGIPSG